MGLATRTAHWINSIRSLRKTCASGGHLPTFVVVEADERPRRIAQCRPGRGCACTATVARLRAFPPRNIRSGSQHAGLPARSGPRHGTGAWSRLPEGFASGLPSAAGLIRRVAANRPEAANATPIYPVTVHHARTAQRLQEMRQSRPWHMHSSGHARCRPQHPGDSTTVPRSIFSGPGHPLASVMPTADAAGALNAPVIHSRSRLVHDLDFIVEGASGHWLFAVLHRRRCLYDEDAVVRAHCAGTALVAH